MVDIKNVDDIVKYINLELQRNKDISVNKLAAKIGVKTGPLKERLKSGGYKFNIEARQYFKSGPGAVEEKIEERLQEIPVREIDADLKEKLINLAENYNKIMALIEVGTGKDESKTTVSIDLPEENNKNCRPTIRVNSIIWENFKTFADLHPQFTQKDLISQALQEFVEKYK